MAKSCAACDDLRNDAPNFVANGLGDTEINSLKNNTGLNPSSGNDDCEDLNNMNDCLIGNMVDEVDLKEVCDWKEYTKDFVSNAYAMFGGVISAICGLWTAVLSFRLRRNGNYIILDAWDGERGRVNLADIVRTYRISKSGHTITLTGSDGTTSTVTDDNTTYGLSKSGTTITLTGTDGRTSSVTDSNTTYGISKSGNTITLTGSDGATSNVTDKDTTYGLSKSSDGKKIVLTPSSGSAMEVTDNNTKYRMTTASYTLENVAVVAGDTTVVELPVTPPSFPDVDTFYPMAVAGWTWEGTFASYLVTRYIQLTGRSTDTPKVKVAIRNIASPEPGGTHDALVTFTPEVMWFGVRTD